MSHHYWFASARCPSVSGGLESARNLVICRIGAMFLFKDTWYISELESEMLILGLACWWEGPVSGAAIRCVHVCHAAPIQYPQVNLTARKCILCVCVCDLSAITFWVMQKNQNLLADQQRQFVTAYSNIVTWYFILSGNIEKVYRQSPAVGASCFAAHAASCWLSTFTGNSIGANLSHGEKVQILKWIGWRLASFCCFAHISSALFALVCCIRIYIYIFMTQDQAIEWFCAKA